MYISSVGSELLSLIFNHLKQYKPQSFIVVLIFFTKPIKLKFKLIFILNGKLFTQYPIICLSFLFRFKTGTFITISSLQYDLLKYRAIIPKK